MSENITEEINENIEPPEVKLTTPDSPETSKLQRPTDITNNETAWTGISVKR